MKRIFLTIFIFLALLLPVAVLAAKASGLSAAGGNLSTVGGKTGLGGELYVTFSALAKGLLGAVGTIFFFLTIYAGGLWLTSAGNEERITKAKTILFTCVIGLFITLSAYAITNFITTKLGGAPSATAPPGGPGIAPPQAVVGCCMSFVINGTLQTTECYEGYTKAECEDESDEASGVRDSWLPTECSVDRRCPQYPEENIPQYPYK